jgi:hypothetical protein
LGEKLQELILEARPLLKDMKAAIKEMHQIETAVSIAVTATKQQVERAGDLYELNKEMEKSLQRKAEMSIEHIRMANRELLKLQELHAKIQREISQTITKYIDRKHL